jgi:ectoine hydroxylase-related dioxygenase (phytanoyl-CoA dioxygenase family)
MKFTAITQEQRNLFYDEGYLIVRNALDEETIEQLIAAGDRLCDSDKTENRQRTPDGLYDGFRNCIALDDAFLPLLTWEKTVPLIVQLFGANIHLVTSHLIYKHQDVPSTPLTTRAPGWHRDIQGTSGDLGHAHIPRMEMKCAYYLTDLTEPNWGATLFAPGSNHLKKPLEFLPGKPDPENVVEPLLKAGDAVFFENRTWHAASVNHSPHTRKAGMFGYGFQWLKPMDYFFHGEELANKTDDIGKQLLGALKDKSGAFVPGGIHAPLQEWCEMHDVHYEAPQ